MSRFILLSLAILAFVGMASAHIPMGAASFGWPPPRSWDDAAENNSPCGSSEGPGARTNFTYRSGYVLLYTQAKAWNLRLGVSTFSHPQSIADFKPLLTDVSIAEVDAGITCINVPDASVFLKPGHPATLQLQYVSQYGSTSGHNMSFYACADINYVDPKDIPFRVPCFNTTEPKDRYTRPTARPKPKPKDQPEAPKVEKEFTPGKTDDRLPKAAIYGIGFGSGLASVFILFVFFKCVVIPRRERRNREAIERGAS